MIRSPTIGLDKVLFQEWDACRTDDPVRLMDVSRLFDDVWLFDAAWLFDDVVFFIMRSLLFAESFRVKRVRKMSCEAVYASQAEFCSLLFSRVNRVSCVKFSLVCKSNCTTSGITARLQEYDKSEAAVGVGSILRH